MFEDTIREVIVTLNDQLINSWFVESAWDREGLFPASVSLPSSADYIEFETLQQWLWLPLHLLNTVTPPPPVIGQVVILIHTTLLHQS